MSKIFKDELYTGFLINPEIVALKEANVELNKRIKKLQLFKEESR